MRGLSGKWALLITAFLWSSSGLFFRLIGWNPVIIAGMRSFISFVFMFSCRTISQRRTGRSIKMPVKSPAFWLVGITYAGTLLLNVTANKLTTSANAILLQYSAPVWTAILGWIIIKEKPHAEHWIGMALVFAGLIIFFKDSLGGGALLGDILAVCSGITFAASVVFMRIQKHGESADGMMLAHLIAAIIGMPFIFVYPPSLAHKSVFAILFLGFIQVGLSSIIYSYGMKRINALAAVLILTLEPILNPVWVLLAMGEKPSVSAIIGGSMIITAVLATSIIGKYKGDKA
jgi:drug/metabolite transporter (DMT)-like permease